MIEYFVLIFGFLVLMALKYFLVNRTYNQKKNLYQNPLELAQDLCSKKDKNIKQVLQEVFDVKTVMQIITNALAIISKEWRDVKENNKKDPTLICDRFRHMAVLINVIILQHKKDELKPILRNKMDQIERMIRGNSKLLDEIKKDMSEHKHFTKFECITISNYYEDIFEILDKNK